MRTVCLNISVVLQTATGPLGNERTIIVTLKEAPVYDNKTGTLTYNASIILQNTTLSDSPEALQSRDVINNMARGLATILVKREDLGSMPVFNMTDVDLFIDNVSGMPAASSECDLLYRS